MFSRRTLSRRTLLRGLGTAVALPWLECMTPRAALAAPAAGAAPTAPRRLAFVYVPNGIHMPDWTPTSTAADFKLPYLLEPLAPVRDRLLVLSGLAHDKARSNGDGAGDHARAAAVFLTGCQPRKTSGANIKAGVSVDQIAAARLGEATRLASLELGCDESAGAGNCDSGYSCAYNSNISWKTESMPMAKETDPRLVFERLFGSGRDRDEAQAQAERQARRRSVLDYVRADAERLERSLAGTDRHKLDEYLTNVRELERRLERVETERAAALPPGFTPPDEIPEHVGEHIRLMYDLMALAFRSDLTRVATFMVANEGSNRTYPFLGVKDGHHSLSHHGGDKDKQAKIRAINRFHTEHFATFLKQLAEAREPGGSVLDNSLIIYGSCIGDGDRHNHDNLPILLAGRGGGSVASGRHLEYPKNTPVANLYLSLLDRVGAPAEHVGDSTGRLEKL